MLRGAAANKDLTRDGVLAAVGQLTSVDYEGMLPSGAGNFSASPQDGLFRSYAVVFDGPDGLILQQGPIFERSVLRFRSYVAEPLRYGNLFLAGDAGHTVPPTGAKGLNLALTDVALLATALRDWAATGSRDLLDGYSDRALDRTWRTQNFSYWMTTMLHEPPAATTFDRRRQLGELEAVVASPHGAAYLAEAYTGWPR